MTQTPAGVSPYAGKGKAFFDRADQVAETGNWDYAIQMYIDGIRREPDNLDRGHKRLRDVSLKRKAQGGKNAGMMEVLKLRPGKDPLDSLCNAEMLLAKEPGSVSHMGNVLKAAQALNLPAVAKWICDILLEVERQAIEQKGGKPDKRVLILLIKSFTDMEQYTQALMACDIARRVSPNDGELQGIMMELSAKNTIQKGKYDQEGDFTKGVVNLEKQKEFAQKDMAVQGKDYLAKQVERARQDYLATPTAIGKINGLADALLKFEEESYENEAIDVLAKAHRDSGAYQFKMRIGDVRIRQMTRRYRDLMARGDKPAAAEEARKLLAFELEEYSERTANYPTDLSLKYELGRRQFLAGKYDDAIASLQQAQRDPRRHGLALNYLGQAFSKKGWFQEAADSYEKALAGEQTEDKEKETRYNLGDCLMQMSQHEKAREQFSRVAQIDYNYKDVRKRLDDLRSQAGGSAPAGG